MNVPRSVFEAAERVLTAASVDARIAETRLAVRGFLDGPPTDGADGGRPPAPITFVRFPDRPNLVDPRQLPRRNLQAASGRIALLHAVAHIEFTAVSLAWDLLYRFRGLPDPFYRDWLRVAGEEAEHFELIRRRLNALGAEYGDLPAHRGLWDVAADTAHDLAARLALVPRGMEARGLDVTPGLIARLAQVGDVESCEVLKVILRDEVGHVALGSRWFRWVCEQRGVAPEDEYRRQLRLHLRGELRGPYNLEARREAGFTDTELAELAAAAQRGAIDTGT
ncbi:ferritin-like domain-containing protein [Methylotetracoccus oryzae]|uniref:ferritin-like domain-containing protein n=1 Tax=Methylotetracoccus oryzae TaxID=1919059 RepID=UPI00111A53B9|nr:ferritin-like domain-containing protein [Methylotetracoccus oryzae]